ncbi:MAG: GreA/GreB family elongation factor, partial [Phycisphaerae bacterium]|nr:GreA/GreB family elongation factor [Phycisphaerae bacterium]
AKLLQTLHDIDHKSEAGREWKKAARQRIRSALAVRDFASYRAAVAEMDESMAGVIKGKIERSDGLALAVRDKMLDSLKENFYSLFIEKKKDPWLDENIIWTTQAAMDARTEEMRVLTEEAMPANAKQIGEAAEEGDLRENADWQAAIEERDMLVARARKMNNELTIARILKLSDVPDDTVSVGSLVRLKRVPDGEEIEMSFLGPWDSDPQKRIYAYTTRLAQSLMGKSLGMTFELEIEGRKDEYTIQTLTPSDGLE